MKTTSGCVITNRGEKLQNGVGVASQNIVTNNKEGGVALKLTESDSVFDLSTNATNSTIFSGCDGGGGGDDEDDNYLHYPPIWRCNPPPSHHPYRLTRLGGGRVTTRSNTAGLDTKCWKIKAK